MSILRTKKQEANLHHFQRLQKKYSRCRAKWEDERNANSKIPSIFDHVVRNSSTIESNYQQRPGAFEYAKPLRRWKKDWPESYHNMLHVLREKWPEGRGIQEFVRILQLHKDYPADLIERAVEQALSYGCAHLDGVLHCLHQLTEPQETHQTLDLSDRPHLQNIGNQPVDLSRYEKLLKYSW